jgi:hypothetical protein
MITFRLMEDVMIDTGRALNVENLKSSNLLWTPPGKLSKIRGRSQIDSIYSQRSTLQR